MLKQQCICVEGKCVWVHVHGCMCMGVCAWVHVHWCMCMCAHAARPPPSPLTLPLPLSFHLNARGTGYQDDHYCDCAGGTVRPTLIAAVEPTPTAPFSVSAAAALAAAAAQRTIVRRTNQLRGGRFQHQQAQRALHKGDIVLTVRTDEPNTDACSMQLAALKVFHCGTGNFDADYIFSSRYVHICIYTHMHIYTYAHVRICTCTHMHMYTYAHVHMYTYAHVHICTYAHRCSRGLHLCY